ncbi:hypothetical protein AB0B12_07225 [Streptomyces sp. NPDC044780]|uniref:Uncharacterized protein n=1 Tax=Streptomyces luomodiensis TaxID=3026192 RepID=A0ABY9UP19_9ACTN|nr:MULTISPECIES: hypothetical protein [unclassified Streptomyces]WAP53822.1 hypothetical protein N6H00_01990 [Streptomyces sp. S465]WNE94280.1 hypothetical protein PS467_02540 [Streptomyces sp. SCA4-21]
MSLSELTKGAELARQATELEAQVDALLNGRTPQEPAEVPADAVRSLVTAAARLFTAHAEATGARVDEPLRSDVNPTEAVELACALLRARDLNPFDLALWFSRSR